MNSIVDCSDYKSARKSVAGIFNTTEEKFTRALKSIALYLDADQVYRELQSIIGPPEKNFGITWFHGTRIKDHKSFLEEGILTRSMVAHEIRTTLISLKAELNPSGEYPFKLSSAAKENSNHEGPFANLIKDVAIYSPDAHHDYTCTPEIVEDIAGALVGENYRQLVDRYRNETEPCIVSFVDQSDNEDFLSKAIYYVYLIECGEALIDAASCANTCLNAGGRIIKPQQIVRIEVLGASNASNITNCPAEEGNPKNLRVVYSRR